MHSRFVRVRAVCLRVAAFVTLGCGGGSAPTEDAMLPIGFSERSDVPYIMGTITRRWDESGRTRILVHVPRGTEARVPEAVVSVGSGVLIKWRNGRSASVRELQVGRSVMVWATGGEMRSMPPQVSASAILLGQ